MFWIAAALIAAATLLVLMRALAATPEAGAADLGVYRDQMRELDRDMARGTLTAEEAGAARAEVGRRLLAADAAEARPRHGGRAALGAGLTAVIVVGVAFGTYRGIGPVGGIGAPHYPDLPLTGRIAAIEAARAARPDQEAAEAEIADTPPPPGIDPDTVAMAQRLRDVLAERPDDLQGWRLRVQTEAGLGDAKAAWRAQDRVIAILGDAVEAREFALLAELMIAAAGGYVSPEAERVLVEARRRDPANGSARYHAGLMYMQGGRADLAWPIWRRLVGDSAAGDPWLTPIYAQIERASRLAGDPTPLDALPRPGERGPSAADVAEAGALSPAERMEMIGGMVEGLAARLASDGGPPSDWSRLITAYGVLGRLDDAATVRAEALQVFAGDQGAIDMVSTAAERAGLAP